MPEFAIMNRKLTGWKLGSSSYTLAMMSYERNKEYCLKEKAYGYGDVLVSIKQVKVGITIKIRIASDEFLWKPILDWKHSRHVRWLWFMVWFKNEYIELPDKVICDWLGLANKELRLDPSLVGPHCYEEQTI